MDVRRAPALPRGIDLAAYLSAGGIPPGALIVSEPGSAQILVTPTDVTADTSDASRRALAAMYGVNLSAVTGQTATIGGGEHPILRLTRQTYASGIAHETQLTVFHAMRRFYPTLDQAIRFRRMLEGYVIVTSDDEALAETIQEAWDALPVGFVEGAGELHGGDDWLDLVADTADEYGYGVGEVVLSDDGRDVERLVVPNGRSLSLREVEGSRQTGRGIRYRLHQRQDGKDVPLDGALVHALAFRPTSENAWAEPLGWSLVQAVETGIRQMQSVNQGWWRFGDPSLLLGIEYDAGQEDIDVTELAGADGGTLSVPTQLLLMKQAAEAVMNARREGRAGDAYVAVQGGKIVNEVLGSAGDTMMRYFKEQASHLDALVVGASDVPVWMFPTVERAGDGLGGSLSDNQGALCAAAAAKRNMTKGLIAKKVIDTLLVARGMSRYLGRYDVSFTSVSVLDAERLARTRQTEAQADAATIENAALLYNEDGTPRFTGEALGYLESQGLLERHA